MTKPLIITGAGVLVIVFLILVNRSEEPSEATEVSQPEAVETPSTVHEVFTFQVSETGSFQIGGLSSAEPMKLGSCARMSRERLISFGQKSFPWQWLTLSSPKTRPIPLSSEPLNTESTIFTVSGDDVLDFEVKLIDGERLRPSVFQNQSVALIFWSSHGAASRDNHLNAFTVCSINSAQMSLLFRSSP
ncbi:MAG: hypothetical protein M2R45_03778 [Verrucomicrobia subdivision 3 bacterium]|nr:hypothetical protein [Limisphaerales bacterium]MCS1416781.1 hypothetical protein [Limisphaerales bacterium]